MSQTKLTAALLGLATGDAPGVPVEFVSRTALQHNPVTTMQGYSAIDSDYQLLSFPTT